MNYVHHLHTAGKLAIGGMLALVLLFGSFANAQTTTSTTTTPGTPNTGAGGDATRSLIVLASSAVVALAGVVYFVRRKGA